MTNVLSTCELKHIKYSHIMERLECLYQVFRYYMSHNSFFPKSSCTPGEYGYFWVQLVVLIMSSPGRVCYCSLCEKQMLCGFITSRCYNDAKMYKTEQVPVTCVED